VQKADSSSRFDELDAALQSGSSDKRHGTLRQVTDLLLTEADRLSEEQIGIFDLVLVQLIQRTETRTLAAPVIADGAIDARPALDPGHGVLVDPVALSLLSAASLEIIQPLMTSPMDDGLLIPARWPVAVGKPSARFSRSSSRPRRRRRLDTKSSGLNLASCRKRTRSGCFDFGRFVRRARGAPDTHFSFLTKDRIT